MRRRASAAAILAAALVSLAVAVPASAGTAGTAGQPTLTPVGGAETDRGPARLVPLPDGGYVALHSLGDVERVSASGATSWRVDSTDLYKDWHLTFDSGSTPTPQLAWSSEQDNPLIYGRAPEPAINDQTPYAVGDLGGGGPDVVVAENVGITLSSLSGCGNCREPFTVPGSDVHLGTFLTVLDGRDGHMLFSQLEPGIVSQLALDHGRLLVGEELGEPSTAGDIGQWGGTSVVRSMTFSPSRSDGQPALTARQQWRYDTDAPWARFFGLTPTGDGSVALSWSDTPIGLGTPAPPHGHVVLLDETTGARRWDVRTTGYPVLLGNDPDRHAVAVVASSDALAHIGYSVSDLATTDGRVITSTSRDGSVPLSLTVTPGSPRTGATYLVGSIDTVLDTQHEAQSQWTRTAGRISAITPGRPGADWTRVLPSVDGQPVQPGGVVETGGTVITAGWTQGLYSPAPATTGMPDDTVDAVIGLNARTGAPLWRHTGDVGDAMSLSAVPGRAEARTVTDNQDVEVYTADGHVTEGSARFGDLLSAAPVRLPGTGTELVAGDESGAVYAFDGASLSRGIDTARVRWRTRITGPVHQVLSTSLDGRPVVVAVGSQSVGVVDASTGRLLTVIPTDGYTWTATLATVHGHAAVVVPNTRVTAYALAGGARLWRYTPPAGTALSNLAFAHGVVVGEYSTTDGADVPAMASFGLDADSGATRWLVTAPAATTSRGQLWNGVVASPDIPGASGDGVALAWAQPDGDGRIEVRDTATGKLDYADTAGELNDHTGYLVDPKAGLVSYASGYNVTVAPSGPFVAPGGVGGMSETMVDTAAGQVLAAGDGGTTTYPVGVLASADWEMLAWDTTFDADTVVAAALTGGTTQQIVALPFDTNAYSVVTSEEGLDVPVAVPAVVPHGLVVLQPGGSVTANTASSARRSPARSAAPSTPVATPDDHRTAIVQPDLTAHRLAAAPADDSSIPYTPQAIRGMLGLKGDGAGQTIAIVDAFADPSISDDVEHFSSQFGLPGVCGHGGTAGDCFTLDVDKVGSPAADDDWQLETSLDVEWTHAVAPKATIVLAEAQDPRFAEMFAAVDAAAAKHPDVVSMSWGTQPGFSDESYYDHHCQVGTTVCVVSTGDDGYPGEYPAANPAALAIGGTGLTLAANGSVASESSWARSGGSTSFFEPEPAYQQGVNTTGKRQIPDVSFDADPVTGVAVYYTDSDGTGTWEQVGGTSVGAPVWSGILTDADQLRAARGVGPLTSGGDAVQRAVYGLAGTPALADITDGPANGACPTCAPTTGYDTVTGLGSPRSGIDAALAASPAGGGGR